MTITFDVHYGATPYYSSGRKTIQIDWGSNPHPQRYSYIDLEAFLNDQISESETFFLDDKFISIFGFVEIQYGWQISNVFIGYDEGEITWRYLIQESHNCQKDD